MPDCHGRLYSRLSSQDGCCWVGCRFLTFGSAALSSFSTQPSSIMRAGRPEASVRTMMSRPTDWFCESGPWIFPKKVSLSLMSSTYFTLTPYFFSKASIVGCAFVFSSTSMYRGQFENVIVFGSVCATVLAAVEVVL